MTDGDSKQSRIYAGPGAEELEKEIEKWLPGLRIYFPPDPQYTPDQMKALLEKTQEEAEVLQSEVIAGEEIKDAKKEILPAPATVDYALDFERMTETVKGQVQQQILGNLGAYAQATLAEGTFAAKWPLILDKVASSNRRTATIAANMVLDDNFAGAGALLKNDDALIAAQEAYLLNGMREMMGELSISDAEYQTRKRLDPGYGGSIYQTKLVGLLDQYFYFTLQTGTFDRDWPAKMEKITKFDPEIALEAAVKFIQSPQMTIITNKGAPPQASSFDIPTNEFITACKTAQQACVSAAGQGYNAAAAETMAIVNREIRIKLRQVLPEDQADALRELEESTTAAEGSFLAPGIQETIAALSISDEELGARRTLHGYSEGDTERRLLTILDEYFYHALKKGTLLTDWPAKLEEISSFDPDLAAQAASQFFRDAQASITTADEFNRITAAAEQACAAASAKGYFASAARTMADILLQIRKNIKALSGKEEEMVSALRPVGNDAVGKFNTIMEAWATAAFAHPDDTRSPEAIQTAEAALMTFVKSLAAEGFNMDGNLPPAPAAS